MPEFENIKSEKESENAYKPSQETVSTQSNQPEAADDRHTATVEAKAEDTQPSPKKATFTPGPIPGPFDAEPTEEETPAPAAFKKSDDDNRPNMRSRWKRKGPQKSTPAAQPESKMGAIDDISQIKDSLATKSTQPAFETPEPASQQRYENKQNYIAGSASDNMAQDVLSNKNPRQAASPRRDQPKSFDAHLSKAMETPSSRTHNEPNTDMNNNRSHNRSNYKPRKKKGFFSSLLCAIASIFGGGQKEQSSRPGQHKRGGNRRPQGNRSRQGGNRQGSSNRSSQQGNARRKPHGNRNGGGNRRPHSGGSKPRSTSRDS